MSRPSAFPLLFAIALVGACKTHRLPQLPPERDPADERAPIVPYRAPPDVLTTELSKGEPGGGHDHHQHHAPAKPTEPPPQHEHGSGGEP